MKCVTQEFTEVLKKSLKEGLKELNAKKVVPAIVEKKTTEKKATEKKVTEKKVTEKKATEKKTTEKKQAESKAARLYTYK